MHYRDLIDVPEIERTVIDWADRESRFTGSGEGRTVFTHPQANRMPVSLVYSRAGRPASQDGCQDGEHHWISKGTKQVKCSKCPRTLARHLLPPHAAVNHPARRSGAAALPDRDMPKCQASPDGAHKWLSKGNGRVRCSLCRTTAKRLASDL